MTTLTPMLQFIQEKILLCVHPGCSIEEAREKELQGGCILDVIALEEFEVDIDVPCGIVYLISEDEFLYGDEKHFIGQMFDYKIIGLPPTLSRVLSALGIRYSREFGCIFYIDGLLYGREQICKRKLLNEDGTDCNLFQQSEETQNAIALLLGWKDET